MRLSEILDTSTQMRLAKKKKQEAERQADESKASHPEVKPKTGQTAAKSADRR